jgi:hypothetical protein
MLKEFTAIYDIINTIKTSEQDRFNRKLKLASMKKEAFDSRYLTPDIDVNPRKTVQNFHHSQPKMTPELSGKLFQLKRLYDITEIIKNEFQREPEYQESYVRSLNHQLTRVLRLTEMDSNYSDNQQSLSSINYVEELLYSRYRLTLDDIKKMSDESLRDRILMIDDKLLKLDPIVNPKQYQIATQDKQAYNDVMTKILSAPSDEDKVITIKVSKNEEDNKLKNLVASIKSELNQILDKKIQDDSFVSFLENAVMNKYKKALEETINNKISSEVEDKFSKIKDLSNRYEISAKANVIKEQKEEAIVDDKLEDHLAQLDIILEREKHGSRQ